MNLIICKKCQNIVGIQLLSKTIKIDILILNKIGKTGKIFVFDIHTIYISCRKHKCITLDVYNANY